MFTIPSVRFRFQNELHQSNHRSSTPCSSNLTERFSKSTTIAQNANRNSADARGVLITCGLSLSSFVQSRVARKASGQVLIALQG